MLRVAPGCAEAVDDDRLLKRLAADDPALPKAPKVSCGSLPTGVRAWHLQTM